MLKYFLKRLLLAFLTFLIIVFIVYLIQAGFGKNPFLPEDFKPNSKNAAKDIAASQKLAAAHGFNSNVFIRFFVWFKNLFFKGDAGIIYGQENEFSHNIPALFFKPLKWTIIVSLPSFILSLVIGIILGTIAAYNRKKAIDSAIATFVSIFIALPSFVIAPALILIFSKMGLPSEFKDPRDVSGYATFLSLITPIIVYTLGSLAGYTLFIRNQVVSVLTSNQVLIAKAKGLTNFQIFRKHVLRNASIILVGGLILSYIGLLSGSILLERFFRIPGSSNLIIQYTTSGEINVIMFSLAFYTALTLFTMIIADISFVWMDPRIKFGMSNNSTSWSTRLKNHLIRTRTWKISETKLVAPNLQKDIEITTIEDEVENEK
ncbi:ABC transporter permease [Mesomycoplasma neurolyticum]|uniref:Oligopeptide ABC transporter permease n=1 Tax=Mesomycoplasma neurolyticum TaxID=2120 RepID=A0A449A6F8_9BACT|nr:ABC transporter permease [Mesomycoplasma neurolyticum]VEU59845.1 oligopeptide ABC transporter permease [Mesomycoplasma neurolyticum]